MKNVKQSGREKQSSPHGICWHGAVEEHEELVGAVSHSVTFVSVRAHVGILDVMGKTLKVSARWRCQKKKQMGD